MTTDGPQQLTGYVMRDYDELVATLARSRESQGLRQRVAAQRAGCAAATLSEAERGIHELRARYLFALAEALGYDLALVPRDGEGPSAGRISPESAEQPSAGGAGRVDPLRTLSGRPRRLRECVERWPGAEIEGDYDPRCCRFPKSCSASVYDAEHVTDEDLEDA